MLQLAYHLEINNRYSGNYLIADDITLGIYREVNLNTNTGFLSLYNVSYVNIAH